MNVTGNANVNREYILRRIVKHLYEVIVFNNSQIIPLLMSFLKLLELSGGSRRRSGKEFHEVRLATEKARRPNVFSR